MLNFLTAPAAMPSVDTFILKADVLVVGCNSIDYLVSNVLLSIRDSFVFFLSLVFVLVSVVAWFTLFAHDLAVKAT